VTKGNQKTDAQPENAAVTLIDELIADIPSAAEIVAAQRYGGHDPLLERFVGVREKAIEFRQFVASGQKRERAEIPASQKTEQLRAAIESILALLPATDDELIQGTTPQLPGDLVRERLRQARAKTEAAWPAIKRNWNELAPTFLGVMEILPRDLCHYEMAIAHPKGQAVARQNFMVAKRELQNLLEAVETAK